MNLQNIISAGKMMAIVVMLLGAFHCGMTFVMMRETMVGALQAEIFRLAPLCNIAFGTAVIACGFAMMVMFPRSERRPGLGTPVLAVATLAVLLGVADVVIAYRNPFSWMIAIVCLAIFIDAICLKICLSSSRNS